MNVRRLKTKVHILSPLKHINPDLSFIKIIIQNLKGYKVIFRWLKVERIYHNQKWILQCRKGSPNGRVSKQVKLESTERNPAENASIIKYESQNYSFLEFFCLNNIFSSILHSSQFLLPTLLPCPLLSHLSSSPSPHTSWNKKKSFCKSKNTVSKTKGQLTQWKKDLFYACI